MMILPPSDAERRRRWRRQNQTKAPTSSPVLPNELITEVISFLDVKSLMKIRCVSKSMKSLISNPTFVQFHLKRSGRNPQFALYLNTCESKPQNALYVRASNGCASVIPFPVSRLLENPLNTLPTDPCYQLMDKDCYLMVGSCNGLVCLKGFNRSNDYEASWFYFWNPAIRKMSKKLGYFRDYSKYLSSFKYMFGYDDSTRTYKLVALHFVGDPQTLVRTDVKVLNLGDNVWRVIQNLPLVTIGFGVDYRGSLNWLSLPNVSAFDDTDIDPRKNVTRQKFVISSFNLATKTFTQILPPSSFELSRYIFPHIRVLVDCLCFSHDVERTHLLIWKMIEFGVQESWTPFLKISYQNLSIGYNFCDWRKDYDCRLVPLHLSESNDTLIFLNREEDTTIFYNWTDNTVKETRITQKTWWCLSHNYVESLVSPY